MAQQQQTELRVRTNIPNPDIILPNGTLGYNSSISSGITITGSGTFDVPYTGTGNTKSDLYFTVNNTTGIIDYNITSSGSTVIVYVWSNGNPSTSRTLEYFNSGTQSGTVNVNPTDVIYISIGASLNNTTINSLYFSPNLPDTVYFDETLDLYGDVPIKINKSFAELQDIAKRNSDYSIGLSLPGSKKNNRFFEGYYNVDNTTLYFDPTLRVPCEVLLNDVVYFRGYMKLNKVSVLNSKVEYDVTLFSTVSDVFGKIGNNLLKDLDYNDNTYPFNHEFNRFIVRGAGVEFAPSIFGSDEMPNYFYPIVHNGYNYDNNLVRLSGGTTDDQTRLYTTTGPISGYTTTTAMYGAGVKRYRINSPQDGILDNQLKPALNIKALINLIFKTYGYTIKSDFFNTPWFRMLYMYGYFSSETTKLSYRTPQLQILPVEGVQVVAEYNTTYTPVYSYLCGQYYTNTLETITFYVVKTGTGTPVLSDSPINITMDLTFTICYGGSYNTQQTVYIPAGQSSVQFSYYSTQYVDCGGCPWEPEFGTFNGLNDLYSNITLSNMSLDYYPQQANTDVVIQDGDDINFSLLIDQRIKQIDILSSIAKKFNLVFVPDPEVPNQIIIEPYDYYIGTGNIYDWTQKLSYDKGWSVEPALNFIESELVLTDLEDGDEGNKQFKDRNNRLYGENKVYNPTDFKSQTKKIDTIFSPQLIRRWDTQTGSGNVSLPLGINYAGTTNSENNGATESVVYLYKGIKSKPKLFYYLGNYNPFLDTYGETIVQGNYQTYKFFINASDGSSPGNGTVNAPIISHTMPLGNPDSNKINNDSISVLFNSEVSVDVGGVSTFDAFTNNDAYQMFYSNRINNLYNNNTRFLSGNFDLKLSDILNLQPNDLIKIKEQYFTWNKIDGFNLTNQELTKTELIQAYDFSPRTYPDRYFKYYYCDNPSVVYKFKTDFTNPSLQDTNYGWSVLYDYNIGILGGAPISSYVSSVMDLQSAQFKYIPYLISEIDETEYNTITYSWNLDTLRNYINANFGYLNTYNYRTYISNTGATASLLMNLFTGCTDFNSYVTSFGINVGSSTYHGAHLTPTPTPTVTPTMTPALPDDNPFDDTIKGARGSLLVTFDEILDTQGGEYYRIFVNGALKEQNYTDSDRLYTIPIFDNDVVNLQVFTLGLENMLIDVYRRNYTNDDVNGDLGVNDTYVAGTIINYGMTGTSLTFIVDKPAGDYGFEYRIGASTCFESGTGFNDDVFDIELENDYIYTAGAYTTYDGDSTIKMSRLYKSGYLDTGFTVNFPTTTPTFVRDFKFQSDGKFIVATSDYRILRFESNGTIDNTFYSGLTSIGVTVSDEIIAIQNDGKILIGGFYSGYTSNSTTYSRNSLVRLNTDGSVDTSFNIGTGIQLNSNQGYVYEIDIQSDGKILVGGNFNKYNGNSVSGLVRLNSNGSIDTTFSNTGASTGNTILDLIVLSNNKILVAGDSQTYFGVNKGNIVRLNSDGGIDNTFINIVSGSSITSMNVNVDGTILIAGVSLNTPTISGAEILKLNPDGSLDTTFTPGYCTGGNVQDMEVQSDGKIILGGGFTTFNGQTVGKIVKLNPDGSINDCGTVPTPTPTVTATVTPTMTPTPTRTPTPTPTVTITPTINYPNNINWTFENLLGPYTFNITNPNLLVTSGSTTMLNTTSYGSGTFGFTAGATMDIDASFIYQNNAGSINNIRISAGSSSGDTSFGYLDIPQPSVGVTYTLSISHYFPSSGNLFVTIDTY